jgi:hypothetical protein
MTRLLPKVISGTSGRRALYRPTKRSAWFRVFSDGVLGMGRLSVLGIVMAGLIVLGGSAWGFDPGAAAPGPMMGADCRGTTGAVQPLAMVKNTYDRNYQCLGVRVDAGANITAIRFESHRSDGTNTVQEFSPAEVASDRGAVLDGRPGHDAVILRGRIAARTASAALTLEFLRNGLTGDYHQCGFSLSRDAYNRWHLLDALDRSQNLIVIETWSLPLVGTVGINNVRGICAT